MGNAVTCAGLLTIQSAELSTVIQKGGGAGPKDCNGDRCINNNVVPCVSGVTCCDGSENMCHSSDANTNEPWLRLDLGVSTTVTCIHVYNRQNCCSERLGDGGAVIYAGPDASSPTATPNYECNRYTGSTLGVPEVSKDLTNCIGRYLFLVLPGTNRVINLREVKLYGTTTAPTLAPSLRPTTSPTVSPVLPSVSPISGPSVSPTAPTFNPSIGPTKNPSWSPSTTAPSLAPTTPPSFNPSTSPTTSRPS
eukprot:Hpha_TRINITY_DN2642_c0_g1::TRINITY_DN2642_c0_g1_i1::g.145848::m.145848